MAPEHPNIAVIKKFNPRDLGNAQDYMAKDLVWHFFNPKLPALQGDHIGIDGLKKFFALLGGLTKGTFQVELISVHPIGDELVTMHTQNTMMLADENINIDVVLVWRVVEGYIKEVWDIPSVYTKSQ